MSKIILVSCVSKKLDHPAKARELYITPWFKYNMKYAELQNPDAVFIISAEHGIIELDKIIEPYDTTLNNMSAKDRRIWAQKVMAQLNEISDINNDEFIILAGRKYREYIIPYLKNVNIPFEGLGILQQLSKLKEITGGLSG